MQQGTISEGERFQLFEAAMRRDFPNRVFSEASMREAYLEHRVQLIRRELKRATVSEAVAHLLAHAESRIHFGAALAAIAALAFPPFYLAAQTQSFHLGFGFVLGNHLGRIDSPYLALELGVIGGLHWLAMQLLRREGGASA